MILRKRWSETAVLAAVVLFACGFMDGPVGEAFAPAPASVVGVRWTSTSLRTQPQHRPPPTEQGTLSLLMSDNSNNSNDADDDELSKLIGKRNQIKRKRSENSSNSSIEDKLSESIEPTVDLDLDRLPAFKTERPVRRAKKSSGDEDDSDDDASSKSSKTKEQAPIIDYMADYDDENEWHIPNRLVATGQAWGDSSQNFVDTNKKLTQRMLKAGKFVAGDCILGVTELLQGGVTALETCPSYGDAAARSRKTAAIDILKQCLAQQQQDGLPEPQLIVQLESGLAPKLKSLVRPSSTLVASLEQTLAQLDESIATTFLAPHVSYTPTRLLAAGLAAQIESGQAEYVGVSNIASPSTLRRLCQHLERRDCALTAAAFDFSLTNTKNQRMVDACKILNVVPLATNPLDGGLASGQYTASNPSGGLVATGTASQPNNKFSFAKLEKLQPLHSVLETTAERVQTRVRRSLRDTQERFKSKYGPPPEINTDITTTQVALQWVISKGAVPVTQVNSPAQAKEVLGCLGWTLTEDEVDQLDKAAALCSARK